MRKRELNGRIKTLAHNVMDSMEHHLALDNVFEKQKKALGLDNIICSRELIWKVDVVIDGKLYEGSKRSCKWVKK